MMGQVMRPPRVAESKGLQNKHLKWKSLIFCTANILKIWDKYEEIQSVFVIF